MTDLKELLERVKATVGPDRSLDHTIEGRLREHVGGMGFGVYENADKWIPEAIKRNFNTPRYTASIDDALALAELVLPGRRFSMFTDGSGNGPCCIVMRGDEPVIAEARGPTVSLAILATMLLALIAKDAEA